MKKKIMNEFKSASNEKEKMKIYNDVINESRRGYLILFNKIKSKREKLDLLLKKKHFRSTEEERDDEEKKLCDIEDEIEEYEKNVELMGIKRKNKLDERQERVIFFKNLNEKLYSLDEIDGEEEENQSKKNKKNKESKESKETKENNKEKNEKQKEKGKNKDEKKR